MRSARAIPAALAFGLCMLAAQPSDGLDVYWQHTGTPGDWFTPGNWLPTLVPGSGDSAIVDNTGTAQINGGAAQAGSVYLGRAASASGTLQITGGTLSSGSTYVGYENGSDGTLQIGGGTVNPGNVYVGYLDGSSGSVTQTGGTVNLGGRNLNLASYYYSGGSSGSYELTDGILQNVGYLNVGSYEYGSYGGSGTFEQSGGTLSAWGLYVGKTSGDTSQCTFSGGTQSFSAEGRVCQTGTVEVSGSADLSINSQVHLYGQFNQSGGSVTVGDDLYISTNGTYTQTGGTLSVNDRLYVFSNGTYDISGAGSSLSAGSIGVYNLGEFNHSGGDVETGSLAVDAGGTYTYSGGTLDIGDAWSLDGTFDFGGSAVGINVGSVATASSVNLSSGTISNAGSASLNVLGSDSFVLLAPGQQAAFGSFSNQGTTHEVGSTLVVAAGKTVTLTGNFPDHAQVQGTLTYTGGSVNLNDGLEVSGFGVVSLGSGKLTVEDAVSGISDSGQLSAGSVYVGKTGTASFAVTGGTFSSGNTYVGYENGSSGTLQISGGTVNPGYVYVGYLDGSSGSVTQTGGTVNLGGRNLNLASYYYSGGSSGSYELTDGILQNVGYLIRLFDFH